MVTSFWNDPVIILYILIAILVLDKLWAVYLMLREILAVRKVLEVPNLLRPHLPGELFEAMRIYKMHKSWLFIVNTLVMIIICGCLELYFGFYAYVWRLANHMAVMRWMEHEVVVSLFFVCLVNIYMAIKSLPGMVYERLCIISLVKRYRVKWYIWLCSFILDALFTLIVLAAIVVVLIYMTYALGIYAFVGLFAVTLLGALLLILLLPFAIEPFLGKRVPLENEALKADLEKLTAKVGFPMHQVHLIRIRDSTTGSNAFFYGSCCLKRIIIFDNLLANRGLASGAQLPPEEAGKGLQNEQVVAVVAHELGHWKRGHFYKGLAMFTTHLLLTLLIFGLCFPHGPIYEAVGFEHGLQPTLVGYIIMFGYVMTPYFTISNVLMLTATRHFEYEADQFANQLGYGNSLKQALLKLYADNLSFPISDECYSMWHHTHPPMLHRLKRLETQ